LAATSDIFPNKAYKRILRTTISILMNSRAFIAIYPIPELADIVSATINVTHMIPREKRMPTKMDGKAAGRITFQNKEKPLNP
jgi:hypothetical protein